MKKYVVKIPFFVPYFYPKRVWHFSRTEKTIYLSFDDGPIPEMTPWVLNELEKHNAKATFFCIGKNIEENPTIFQQIRQEGHTVGNHTFNHLNANKVSDREYIENTLKAEPYFEKVPKLFRPPYGKLNSKKANLLINKGYKIVMWDVLSADFDQSITKEACLKNVINNTQEGSIIIFHDSKKAAKNIQYVLPKVLTHFSEKGYRFKAIA
ncbi:MAG: polysaccharide deacetylase family protein [Flavobacteriaceae bacterium]|nr:polysaccharide deacetylase family protein [Flavobacteriaceae bacterium]